MRARSVFLVAALSLPAPGSAQPPSDCIDYADYVRPLGGVSTSDRAVHIAVAGDFAYVADGFSGLQVIDVADPLNPRRAGGAATQGFAQAVAVDQGIAVVAAGSALFIFDVSDPSTPQPLASIPATNPQGVALSGGRAFVADGLQLLIVDVSDPSSTSASARSRRTRLPPADGGVSSTVRSPRDRATPTWSQAFAPEEAKRPSARSSPRHPRRAPPLPPGPTRPRPERRLSSTRRGLEKWSSMCSTPPGACSAAS